jgi:hypothetical protein
MRAPLLLAASGLLTGCTSIFTLRVPLGDGAPQGASSTLIVIDDQRPAAAREVHAGGGLGRCERWYGDETYVPPKLEYLRELLAEHARTDATVNVRLRRFDTIEYCENTASRAGAAAAAGASAAMGNHVVTPARQVPGGDSVLVRLAGEINGVPFDLSRGFDYEDLPYNALTDLPAANPAYRHRMANAIKEIVEELAALAGKLE